MDVVLFRVFRFFRAFRDFVAFVARLRHMATTAAMRKQLFINDEWRDAAGGKTIDVVNPGD